MAQRRSNKGGTRVNYSGFTSFREQVKKGIVDASDDAGNQYSVSFRRWAEFYRTFLKRRFKEQAAGAGEWDEIAESTKRWRKAKRGVTHSLILTVTGALYKATGAYEKRTKYGVTVGMAAESHDDYEGTTQDLALLHATGRAHPAMPSRVIIVPADDETIGKMNRSLRRAHAIELNKANRKVK